MYDLSFMIKNPLTRQDTSRHGRHGQYVANALSCNKIKEKKVKQTIYLTLTQKPLNVFSYKILRLVVFAAEKPSKYFSFVLKFSHLKIAEHKIFLSKNVFSALSHLQSAC